MKRTEMIWVDLTDETDPTIAACDHPAPEWRPGEPGTISISFGNPLEKTTIELTPKAPAKKRKAK